jgi:hypothetical protein
MSSASAAPGEAHGAPGITALSASAPTPQRTRKSHGTPTLRGDPPGVAARHVSSHAITTSTTSLRCHSTESRGSAEHASWIASGDDVRARGLVRAAGTSGRIARGGSNPLRLKVAGSGAVARRVGHRVAPLLRRRRASGGLARVLTELERAANPHGVAAECARGGSLVTEIPGLVYRIARGQAHQGPVPSRGAERQGVVDRPGNLVRLRSRARGRRRRQGRGTRVRLHGRRSVRRR